MMFHRFFMDESVLHELHDDKIEFSDHVVLSSRLKQNVDIHMTSEEWSLI